MCMNYYSMLLDHFLLKEALDDESDEAKVDRFVSHMLSQVPKNVESPKRKNSFHTRCLVNNKAHTLSSQEKLILSTVKIRR